ncbi:hypothetical protein [Trichothermofontia sp.]
MHWLTLAKGLTRSPQPGWSPDRMKVGQAQPDQRAIWLNQVIIWAD